jgi:hypothetical protein
VWLHVTAIRGLHQTERTLLCMWMVYSRATTSSMALRPWGPVLPAAALLDLEALGMATVLTVYRMSSIGSRWSRPSRSPESSTSAKSGGLVRARQVVGERVFFFRSSAKSNCHQGDRESARVWSDSLSIKTSQSHHLTPHFAVVDSLNTSMHPRCVDISQPCVAQ